MRGPPRRQHACDCAVSRSTASERNVSRNYSANDLHRKSQQSVLRPVQFKSHALACLLACSLATRPATQAHSALLPLRELSTTLKVSLHIRQRRTFLPPTMSSTTSITLTPPRRSRRPDSIKRIKLTTTPHLPTSDGVPIESPLDLPVELMAKVLVFLAPDIVRPGFCSANCGLANLAQASKRCRALALDEDVWKCICKLRWKNKVDFASRMAKAESEAEGEMKSAIAGIDGNYWHSKFVSEERDAARTTITPSELHSTTFTVRLWFRAPSYPPNIKKVKGIYSSGLDDHSLSDNVRFETDGTVTGLPRKYDEQAFFEMDNMGSPSSLAPTVAGHSIFIVGQIGGGSFGLKRMLCDLCHMITLVIRISSISFGRTIIHRTWLWNTGGRE